MASIGITIAKRNSSSLLRRLPGNTRFSLNHGKSHHRSLSRSFVVATTAKAPVPSSLATATPGSGARRRHLPHASATLSPRVTAVRAFGRKGSKMGHHLQNLDEMAHRGSREEAKHRREEKKKHGTKARVEAKKEGGAGEEASEEGDAADADGGGGHGRGDGDFGPGEDEHGNPLLPDAVAVRANLLGVVASLERSFASLRGGEATPALFDAVRVSCYGESLPLASVAQVVIDDPRRATIGCFDPLVAGDVRDAIRDMPGMNLSPYVEEGGMGDVIVPIPRPSEEGRRDVVKELGRQAEHGKQRLSKIRRKAMDVINKGKQGKLEGISKDDAFRVGKEVDAAQKEVLAVLKDVVEKKQKSVMED